MKNIKDLIMSIVFICTILVLSACSAINPYLEKAAEASIETSTKALEAAVFYECDRARIGDLMRRYPAVDDLMAHLQWCANKKKSVEWGAPKVTNND